MLTSECLPWRMNSFLIGQESLLGNQCRKQVLGPSISAVVRPSTAYSYDSRRNKTHYNAHRHYERAAIYYLKIISIIFLSDKCPIIRMCNKPKKVWVGWNRCIVEEMREMIKWTGMECELMIQTTGIHRGEEGNMKNYGEIIEQAMSTLQHRI